MDQSSVLNKICRDELGLDQRRSAQLQSNVKSYIEAWNRFAVPGQRFNELSDAEVKEFPERYLDQGWNRNERVGNESQRGMKVEPGKLLWPSFTGLNPPKYVYSEDAQM